jgi:hypothetical protein
VTYIIMGGVAGLVPAIIITFIAAVAGHVLDWEKRRKASKLPSTAGTKTEQL